MFIDWALTKNNYGEVLATDEYHKAVVEKMKSSKGEKILYYDEFNAPTHATALDFLINKYDWNTKSTNFEQETGEYTFVDFARDNKGKTVTVKYNKYKTPFQAVITGEVEEVSSGKDELGNYQYVGVQVKSSTGKLLTVNPFFEIEGDVVGKEKLTNTSNLIRTTNQQPLPPKPNQSTEEGTDVTCPIP